MRTIFVVLALLSVVGCDKSSDSGKGSKSDKSDKSESCESIAIKDIDKVAGTAMKPEKDDKCAFESKDPDEPRTISVFVTKLESYWDDCKGKAVDDLGDKAKDDGTRLCVKTGKKIFSVGAYIDSDPEKNKAARVKIAKKVLANLE